MRTYLTVTPLRQNPVRLIGEVVVVRVLVLVEVVVLVVGVLVMSVEVFELGVPPFTASDGYADKFPLFRG